MLCSLHIENIAVIEKIDITFNEGFNVLTGETGAGKSIIIDSIEMVLGERASKDLIRNGATNAYVGAVFYENNEEIISKLKDFGVSTEEDNTILIQRELSLDGKSTSRINGRQVTLSILKEIGRLLINIHGQHDNQALLYPENHIAYIDYFAKNEVFISEYKALLSQYNALKTTINSIKMDNEEKERLIETLLYQINEIEGAALTENEDEELHSQKLALLNSEKIITNASYAYELLRGGDKNICDMLSESVEVLEGIAQFSADLEKICASLQNIKYELDDKADELNDYNSELDFSAGDLDFIEARLDLIYRLKRKYGNSVEEIFKFYENAKEKLETIEASDEEIIKLNKKLSVKLEELQEKAQFLSSRRKEYAKIFETQIASELEFLDMAKVKITADIKTSINPNGTAHFLPNGTDIVEFLIATNVGESLKPLSKIASGGELSRIMLSIKNVFADGESIHTLIFDEVDSGVSGKAAHKIGLKLKQVSSKKQVICVTHLAQIAALANSHYLIKKDVVNGKTFTDVKPLNLDERIEELARIMGGIHITQATRKNAEEMITMSETI